MFFLYEVLDKEGKEIRGKVEAVNRTNAISLLQSRGYTIVKLVEDLGRGLFNISFFQRVRVKDIVIFSRQISTLFDAEISALRAFNLVAENVQNKYFQTILKDIASKVEQGSSVEAAFKKYEHIFGEFFVNVVAVGERTGTLSRSFNYLSEYIDRQNELITKVKRALTYPIFVIVIFIAVMMLMFITVIPQISSILIESGQELPFITGVVIGISNFLKGNILLIIILTIVSIAIGVWYGYTPEGKRVYHTQIIRFPLLGKLFREFYVVRFADNLSVMLSSGVPIVNALDTLQNVMVNVVYKDIIANIARKVRQGAPLSAAVENEEFLGKNITQIIKVGEETGELQNMLSVISDFYRRQLTETVSTLIDLIQPTVIIFLGLAVGVLIGSVIVPIYSLSSAI